MIEYFRLLSHSIYNRGFADNHKLSVQRDHLIIIGTVPSLIQWLINTNKNVNCLISTTGVG